MTASHTANLSPMEWTARLHEELRQIAALFLQRERHGHTLQPTALVSELWLKFCTGGAASIADRNQFMALAATNVRRILVDHARRTLAAKRGGRLHPVDPNGLTARCSASDLDVLELDGALRNLESVHPRSARVVELRFFGGMQVEAIASLLGVTDRTVRNDWAVARAWLRQRLTEADT